MRPVICTSFGHKPADYITDRLALLSDFNHLCYHLYFAALYGTFCKSPFTIPKFTLEWTKDKAKYSYQMTPQEYDKYIQDYLTLVENYRDYQNKHTSNTADYAAALKKMNTEVEKVQA